VLEQTFGAADHPQVVAAGIEGSSNTAGHASVRFICGTLQCHHEMSDDCSLRRHAGRANLHKCWAANEAVFWTLVGPDDVFCSDELNHASLIDGIRWRPKRSGECIAQRHGRLGN